MFNGTEQDVKISFYDAQTGAQIPNNKVKVSTADKDLTLNEDQTYTVKRKQIEDLHYLMPGYFSKTDKVHAKVSGLYYLNFLWWIPVITISAVGGGVIGAQAGASIGGSIGILASTGITVGVDFGTGGIFVYPDEVKVFLDPKSK